MPEEEFIISGIFYLLTLIDEFDVTKFCVLTNGGVCLKWAFYIMNFVELLMNFLLYFDYFNTLFCARGLVLFFYSVILRT